jgi:hypothetical protein
VFAINIYILLQSSILKNSPTSGDAQEYIASTHIWKQDKLNVIVWIEIPVESKGSDCNVCITEDSNQFVLSCKNNILLDRELRYKVDIPKDDEEYDWEFVTRSNGKKYFQIVLKKFEYLPGSVFWWSCVFKGDPEIDVSKIAGRKVASAATASSTTAAGGSGSATPTFADNWKKANEMFLEKVAAREREIIDVSIDNEEECNEVKEESPSV